MLLIVGLGNPGEKYKATRHNTGFAILDAFSAKNQFPGFRISKKDHAFISEGRIRSRKVLLVKPQTFMNKSGLAVKTIKTRRSQATFVVVHDDIDILLGKMKISQGRGSAGHKGIESIIKNLKTKNFWRIRIGIQPLEGKPRNVEEFVLKKFTKTESSLLKTVFSVALNVLTAFVEQDPQKAMSHTTLASPRWYGKKKEGGY